MDKKGQLLQDARAVVVLYYDSRDEALLVFARDYPYLYLVFAAYQANRVQTEVVTEVDNIIV